METDVWTPFIMKGQEDGSKNLAPETTGTQHEYQSMQKRSTRLVLALTVNEHLSGKINQKFLFCLSMCVI